MTDSKRTVLTIIVDETELAGEMPLYEAVVRKLVRLEIAGATVNMGIMGFGRHGKVHRKRLFGVADERPVTIVAVDRDEAIRRAIPELRAMMPEGLIYLSEVEVA
ncbi:MAG: DUF190 domain-containing protein [Acidobacteria bacterium]|nr:DUF190 domain-containing protein [Acidobacteriota bacterium]